MRALILALAAFVFSVPGFAGNVKSCASEEMSTALAGSCLSRELKEEEKLLAHKLNALRQGLKRQEFSGCHGPRILDIPVGNEHYRCW